MKSSKKNFDDNSKVNLEKESLQYNNQDLSQEQKMDINPAQLNTQNINIIVSNNYSGRITGTTYQYENKEVIPNANIELFFGLNSKKPVYKTTSDCNGNFTIEDLPPGYYILFANSKKNLYFQSHYFKVFAGQTIHQHLLLNQKSIKSSTKIKNL